MVPGPVLWQRSAGGAGHGAGPSPCRPCVVYSPMQVYAAPPAVARQLQPFTVPCQGPLALRSTATSCTQVLHPHGGAQLASSGRSSAPQHARAKAFLTQSMNADFIHRRFRQLLQLLQSAGVFQHAAQIARARGGHLRLSLPFCGGCLEAPVLGEFLAQLLDKEPGVEKADVLCSDVIGESGVQTSLSAVTPDPRISFSSQVLDLGSQSLPPADLVLGFHPEASRSDTRELWRAVIANCCRAAPLAVFTTLAEIEAQRVREFVTAVGRSVQHLAGVAEDVKVMGDATASYDGKRYANIVLVTE
eukprot:TRINITY_DN65315_c0_g1_i1.p1 TRINITY_DN65315_c0_g1~~TRINITY_DN65315_c0_g1_i1.p1  ORF type:complete len:322 (+),score=48.03 TRINITY_DN65315_c0_g1_i1:59-967(+)